MAVANIRFNRNCEHCGVKIDDWSIDINKPLCRDCRDKLQPHLKKRNVIHMVWCPTHVNFIPFVEHNYNNVSSCGNSCKHYYGFTHTMGEFTVTCGFKCDEP